MFKKKILPVHFVNYDIHDHKEEENFENLVSLWDSEIDPFIHLIEDSDTNFKER